MSAPFLPVVSMNSICGPRESTAKRAAGMASAIRCTTGGGEDLSCSPAMEKVAAARGRRPWRTTRPPNHSDRPREGVRARVCPCRPREKGL